MWFISVPFCRNNFWQTSQEYGFSPVWIRIWRRRLVLPVNTRLHWGHAWRTPRVDLFLRLGSYALFVPITEEEVAVDDDDIVVVVVVVISTVGSVSFVVTRESLFDITEVLLLSLLLLRLLLSLLLLFLFLFLFLFLLFFLSLLLFLYFLFVLFVFLCFVLLYFIKLLLEKTIIQLQKCSWIWF